MTALILLGSGLGATAAPLVYTYTGTVSSGYDQTGVFGTAGATLTGEMFKMVETFDPAVAYYSNTGSSISQAYGGSAYGTSSFATAQITIGGNSAPVISGNYYSYLFNSKGLYHEDGVEDFNREGLAYQETYTSFETDSASTPSS